MREFIDPLRLSAMSDEEVERELYKRVLVDHMSMENVRKVPIEKLRQYVQEIVVW